MRAERRALERTRPEQLGIERTFVACAVGPSHFAIPVESVRQIVAPQKLTPIPENTPLVLGAIDYRGTVVPVVDFARALGQPSSPPSGKEKWILLDFEGRIFGVAVSHVLDVVRVGDSAFRQAPRDQNGAALTSEEVITIGPLIVFVVAAERLSLLAFPPH